jgi:hypothetical protein
MIEMWERSFRAHSLEEGRVFPSIYETHLKKRRSSCQRLEIK